MVRYILNAILFYEIFFQIDSGPQHCWLYDGQKQRFNQLQGYEPYQFVWHYSWSPVRIICCAVLWPGFGSADSWPKASEWNCWTTTGISYVPLIPLYFVWQDSTKLSCYLITYQLISVCSTFRCIPQCLIEQRPQPSTLSQASCGVRHSCRIFSWSPPSTEVDSNLNRAGLVRIYRHVSSVFKGLLLCGAVIW